MSDTTHISLRIDSDILSRVDAEAKRMRWSRNSALNTCVEFGLVDLEQERGPSGGGKLNGRRMATEAGDNSGVEQRGISEGVKESDAGAVQPRRVRSVAGGGDGAVAGKEKRTKKGKGADISEKESVGAGWFPHSKCPHGYQNSFKCEENGGDCKR